MKRFIFLAAIITLISSCDKNDLIVYEEGSGIFFDNRNILLDTISVPWGLKETEIKEQTLKIEVHLFGKVVDYDRAFNVEILSNPEDSTMAVENKDFRPFPTEYIIPAGEATAVIEIDLLRDEALKNGPKTLTIALRETDEFKFLYSRKTVDSTNTTRMIDTQRVIKMNENFPMPRWWPIYGTRYFGSWSMTKSILICDMMNISREKWVGNVLMDEDFNEGILRYAGVYVHRWLAEQDPAILDEDGSPMEMGRESKR